MSIVVNLLRAMNSEINVESVYGQGSVFYFELEQQVQTSDAIGSFLERRKDLEQIQIHADTAMSGASGEE